MSGDGGEFTLQEDHAHAEAPVGRFLRGGVGRKHSDLDPIAHRVHFRGSYLQPKSLTDAAARSSGLHESDQRPGPLNHAQRAVPPGGALGPVALDVPRINNRDDVVSGIAHARIQLLDPQTGEVGLGWAAATKAS
jgi:hypothetical protein